ATAKTSTGSISEKIVLALDKPIKIEPWKETMPVVELIQYLQKKADDVPIRFLASVKAKEPVELMKGELTLGAWIQAMEDSVPEVVFVVREYGILVPPRNRAPGGAESLRHFGRRIRAKEKETEKPPAPKAK